MFGRKTLLVKERVGFLRFVDTFDIYDPATGAQIGMARENTSILLKLLRLLINKRLLPTRVEVREREDTPVLMTLRRGASILMARVSVRDAMDAESGLVQEQVVLARRRVSRARCAPAADCRCEGRLERLELPFPCA